MHAKLRKRAIDPFENLIRSLERQTDLRWSVANVQLGETDDFMAAILTPSMALKGSTGFRRPFKT